MNPRHTDATTRQTGESTSHATFNSTKRSGNNSIKFPPRILWIVNSLTIFLTQGCLKTTQPPFPTYMLLIVLHNTHLWDHPRFHLPHQLVPSHRLKGHHLSCQRLHLSHHLHPWPCHPLDPCHLLSSAHDGPPFGSRIITTTSIWPKRIPHFTSSKEPTPLMKTWPFKKRFLTLVGAKPCNLNLTPYSKIKLGNSPHYQTTNGPSHLSGSYWSNLVFILPKPISRPSWLLRDSSKLSASTITRPLCPSWNGSLCI